MNDAEKVARVDRAPDAAAFRYLGQFQSEDLENRFRQHHLQRDLRIAFVCGLASIGFVLLFSHADYRLFAFSRQFWILLAARAVACLTTIAGLAVLSRTSSPRIFDGTVVLWGLAQVLLVLYVNTTRPRDFYFHNIYDVTVVVLSYVALPLPLVLQCWPALALSAGNMAILFVYKAPLNPLMTTSIVAAYAMANRFGMILAWEAQKRRRLLFAALDKELELRADLEEALAQIRTLRGLVPICAHCKRIRDDAGEWHCLETYVQDRTHARFSHGVCPQCLDGAMTEPK